MVTVHNIGTISGGLGGFIWLYESIAFWIWPMSFSLEWFSLGIALMLFPIAIKGVVSLWMQSLKWYEKLSNWWSGNRSGEFFPAPQPVTPASLQL